MKKISLHILRFFILLFCVSSNLSVTAQHNLLLNGNFEDINVCTEYNAECGVEGWFYMKEVKAQMLNNETPETGLGNNSFAIYFSWLGYTNFSPLIGTLLPCRLQKDQRYTFKGMISAKLNPKLVLTTGIVMGEKYYVPNRPFVADMKPDSIVKIKRVTGSDLYQFEYSFLATGKEKYLVLGTYVHADTTAAKKSFIGTQTVTVVLDNFELLSDNPDEVVCTDYLVNKEKIYQYNYRHKGMDNALYAKGELAIRFDNTDSSYTTKMAVPVVQKPAIADTLKLGDVFFAFNKANITSPAADMLNKFFTASKDNRVIDSIYIEGHTDSVGSDEKNQLLSLQRCNSIKDWLLQQQIISADKIQVHPFGRTRPVATNKTAAGRAKNRRVEMIIFRKHTED